MPKGRSPRPTRDDAAANESPLPAGLLGLQHEAGNAAVSGLLASSRPLVPVQGQFAAARKEFQLSTIQAYAMGGLLVELEKLPAEVRTDEALGRAVGGPRLVTAMRAVVAKKDLKQPWDQFVATHQTDLDSLVFEDQIAAVVAYMGGPTDYTAYKLLPMWPELFAKPEGGPPPAMRARMIKVMLENRESLEVRKDLSPQPSGGYMYPGDPSALKSGSKVSNLEKLAMKELMGEGGPTAVNTYDTNKPPLTLGAGFLQDNAIEWMSTWLGRDPAARRRFLEAGLDIAGGKIQAVQADGTIVTGKPAMAVFAASPKLLSLFMTVGEDPASLPEAVKAQQEWIRQHHVIAAAREAEAAGWSNEAIAVSMHINHWLFAFGWGTNKGAYLATGGDMLKIVKTFGRLAGVAEGSATVVGNGDNQCTTPFSGSHFDAFGKGADASGIAKTRAAEAKTEVSLSLNEIAGTKHATPMLYFRMGAPVSKRDEKLDWWRIPAN